MTTTSERTTNLTAAATGLWDDHVKPAWRGWLHAAAAVAAAFGGLWLIANTEAGDRWAVIVYVACLTGLFATSASYHRFARTDRARAVLRRADHAMIFVLIAGTYTPLCALGLPDGWALPALCVIWAVCGAAAIAKLAAFDRVDGLGRYLYGTVGWAGVALIPAMATVMPGVALIALGVGGVLFSVGAIILARNSPNPAPATFGYHEIWHAFTIAGAAAHFGAVEILAVAM